MRIALLTLVLLLGSASTAAAAPQIAIDVEPERGVTVGDPHEVTATLRDGSAPLAGQPVTLEARPARAEAYEVLGTVATDQDGVARFEPVLDRTTDVRVSGAGALAEGRAVVFPRFRLSARTVGRNLVRLTQSFAREPDAPVTGRVSFYLGRARAETAPLVRRVTLRRRGDRYLGQVTVRVPARYKRRFAYAACLRVRAGSAFGSPDRPCPSKRFRF